MLLTVCQVLVQQGFVTAHLHVVSDFWSRQLMSSIEWTIHIVIASVILKLSEWTEEYMYITF